MSLERKRLERRARISIMKRFLHLFGTQLEIHLLLWRFETFERTHHLFISNRPEIHPLLWIPETFGLTHHLFISNRTEVASEEGRGN
jgi:hypothetical protein